MITIQQAATLLGVTTKTLRLWEKEGKLTSFRTSGGHRRYKTEDLPIKQTKQFQSLDLLKESLIDKVNSLNLELIKIIQQL